MNLFDILTNPIIILIIIGIFSKMVKTQRNNQKGTRKPHPRLNPMDPSHFDKKNIKSLIEEKYERAKSIYTTKMSYEEVKNDQYTAVPIGKKSHEDLAYRVEKKHTIEHHKGTAIEKKHTIEHHKGTAIENPSIKKHKPIKKSKIIEGIIWSEVLGPPRAYKKWSSK